MIGSLIVLVVLGFIAWLIDTKAPMNDLFRAVFRFIVLMVLCLWLLDFFGLYHLANLRR